MNAISFKKWVSTILLLAITISLCGCSTNRTAASQDEHLTTTTAFIVLNGANVPALNSSAIASFVDTPQDGDRSILIVPDGNPSITTFSFDSTAKNVTYATAESKKWYKEICTSIIDARPDDADTDLLSAILLAANELKASDTQARHLMLLCNGLNTAPMLNFAETPFWSDATSIDEIISQLLKLNYLSADTEETRELLSPDATANIFTAFKDFFTMHTLPECQCSNRQWWGITLTTDIGDIYFYNSSDSEVFSSCGQNLIRLLQKNLTINHLFILEKPELNIEASDGTSEITHHEMVSDLLKSFEFDKTKYRNILF